MVIGVDAGALSISDERLKVGVWRVTFELLKILSSIDRRKYYRLYSFAPIEKKIMQAFGRNFHNIVLSPSLGYMKFRLPLELMLHPVDLFLGLSQALPPHFFAKTIGCVYDLAFLHMEKKYGQSYEKLRRQTEDLMIRSDHIVTVSEFTKKDSMKTYAIEKKRISVCYPGVTHHDVRVSKSPVPFPYILFVGALKPAKQIPLAIRGFKAFLQKSTQKYHLLLVGGDYWMDQDIKGTIKELSLEKYVHMVGFVSESMLSSYYRHADAFLSLGSWEGFCMPAVEAMTYGCPVICADSGATPEIVGKAGIPVDPGDSEAIAKTLFRATIRSSFRSDLIQKGKTHASQFTWNRFGKQFLRVIHTL